MRRAVQASPAWRSRAAPVARSYAFQANRRTTETLASAQHMAELAPDSALAYARIAELELARGDQAAAMTAAARYS